MNIEHNKHKSWTYNIEYPNVPIFASYDNIIHKLSLKNTANVMNVNKNQYWFKNCETAFRQRKIALIIANFGLANVGPKLDKISQKVKTAE